MISVRCAAEYDIPELVRLRLAYFEEEFGALPDAQLNAIRAQLPQYFAAHLGRDCYCFAAEKADGEGLCACAILCCQEKPANPHFPGGKSGLVLGVYTEPAYRGQGCATRIMQQLLAEAKRLGLDLVTLSASDMGRPIYEKLGFSVSRSKFTEMEITIEK
ncbi:MAG: GNAT family N-acetyltransferase [Oscillospiraceae bacterium]|nr:GNAT family N-acetyltransferase [Oscillospiraceae bacterium]